jgi:hypothetical protein
MTSLLQNQSARRVIVLLTFVVVFVGNFVWINLFRDVEPEQSAWMAAPAVESVSWLKRYADGEYYYMGYAYALSFSFAVYALLMFVSSRVAATGRIALGGIGLSGFLAAFGCFMIGCCGSPMLAVYLSLFGASFMPFAKPFVALLTTLLIVASWFWLRRKNRSGCSQPGCNC